MLNAILTRWARTRGAPSTLSPSQHTRSSSYPPPRQASTGGDSLWHSLMRWMPGDPDPWFGKAPARPQRPSTQLAAARAQFQAALEGLPGERIEELTRSIHRSRSLRDLWHLRTWIYTEVARAFSQFEAERRLDVINVFLHTHAGMSLRAMNESATQH